MTTPKCIATLLLAALLTGPAFAQPRKQQPQAATPPEDSIVRLISAEKAWQITENGVNYRRVQGDARFLHNDTYLLCDSASWNVDAEVIEAYGNVRLMQDETMLTSDELTYLIPESLAQFKGSVVELLDKDGNRLRTRQLEYNTKDSLAFFHEGGAMKSKEGNVIEGLHGTYDSRTKVFTFEENVKLFMDSILMRTERLTYNSSEEKACFGTETHTWLDETFIRADGGWYTRKDSTLCYQDNVYAMDENYEVWCAEGYRHGPTHEVELVRQVRVLDPEHSTSIYGNRLRYLPDSAKCYVLEEPAVAYYGENENHEIDTLFIASDTMIFRAVPRYEFSEEEIEAAKKRREDALFDALAEFRAKQAAERQQKIEDAMRAAGKLPPLKSDSTATTPSTPTLDGKPTRPPKPSRSTVEETPPTDDDQPDNEDGPERKAAPDSGSVIPAPMEEPDSSSVNCIWAFRNVRMYRTDLQAAADSVTFTTLDSIAMLLGRPVMWNKVKNQLTSERMHLFIKDGSVYRGSMITDARITTREDAEHFNQIKSTEMMGFFRNNELYRYDALGNVAAIFYMEEGGALTNVNVKESKSLTAMIKVAAATRLLYLEDIKSDAYPIPDLESEKQKFKGFEWRGDERPVSRYDVTFMPIPTSWRQMFDGLEKPVFHETDDYFKGYMTGVYEQLALRAEARRWQKIEKNLEKSTRELRAEWARADAAEIDSLAVATDSLTLALLDSLYTFKVADAEKIDLYPDSHPAKEVKSTAQTEVKPAKKLTWKERRALRREARKARRVARRAERAAWKMQQKSVTP
ncbi:MAG: hypothetical protein IJS91_07355 [Bacteroidales bacterium]|nr:hypothetical protein [Bacteroidales bacterium]